MPRIEFENIEQLEDFIKTWVVGTRHGKYAAFFVGPRAQLIMAPTTSTDPVIYASLRTIGQKTANELLQKHNLTKSIVCGSWFWSADHQAIGEQ